ncbi:glycine/betaine ABC transporter substrate-binding protein (plasmid) [Pseudonocardia sp. EC080610-09]|uniref:glycine betaine ABC transporter substrate-binding protein n=1 Tax=unclassified Pseudonocardia TaxID=2619320 RepID=UPI00070659AB|nr:MULTISPECIES: glycine betaine ABC transporter substrate-binding protein [unclassified Pseudonocardia]ALL79668.1 glycine/betaine ABC transporter substrate-binding protein [Pseudonocardia sp. EC080610-09]ALL85377.1 glycine/betaine ABC transporter substrate-binding protein [Pseudonocardia sp. EC080619-01]
MNIRNLTIRLGAIAAALALLTSGCGARSSDSASGGGTDEVITIPVVQGWTDQASTAYLFENILEDNGYTVEIKEIADNAPIYAGLQNGDLDLFPSCWLERTHAQYWAEYKDDLEDLGTWYSGANLFLGVPDYSNVTSIADLPANAAEFDGKIIGIEPGAGLTGVVKDDAFPAYGLDENFDLVLSSTTAMLTELQKAIDEEREIVVTMWAPFWANQVYPIRPLEDPEGAMGQSENVHSIARAGFAADYPKVAEMFANFEMTDDQYGTLEDMIVNDFGQGNEEEAVAAWLDANPDFEPALAKYLQ